MVRITTPCVGHCTSVRAELTQPPDARSDVISGAASIDVVVHSRSATMSSSVVLLTVDSILARSHEHSGTLIRILCVHGPAASAERRLDAKISG
jgi:hypothetical protein